MFDRSVAVFDGRAPSYFNALDDPTQGKKKGPREGAFVFIQRMNRQAAGSLAGAAAGAGALSEFHMSR
jgi:hypothetical protein